VKIKKASQKKHIVCHTRDRFTHLIVVILIEISSFVIENRTESEALSRCRGLAYTLHNITRSHITTYSLLRIDNTIRTDAAVSGLLRRLFAQRP
jgi:hypothetical protein